MQVHIIKVFFCIIYTPTCFDILCHHQGVTYMLLAKNMYNLARSIYVCNSLMI